MSDDYSRDEFYTHSTDKKGHSQTVRVPFPPMVVNMLDEIVASRRIPEFRTKQYIIRDGTYHQLHYLMTEAKLEYDPDMGLWAAESRAERTLERFKTGNVITENLRNAFYEARGSVKELAQVKKAIEAVLETDLPETAKRDLRELLDR